MLTFFFLFEWSWRSNKHHTLKINYWSWHLFCFWYASGSEPLNLPFPCAIGTREYQQILWAKPNFTRALWAKPNFTRAFALHLNISIFGWGIYEKRLFVSPFFFARTYQNCEMGINLIRDLEDKVGQVKNPNVKVLEETNMFM